MKKQAEILKGKVELIERINDVGKTEMLLKIDILLAINFYRRYRYNRIMFVKNFPFEKIDITMNWNDWILNYSFIDVMK